MINQDILETLGNALYEHKDYTLLTKISLAELRKICNHEGKPLFVSENHAKPRKCCKCRDELGRMGRKIE